ncbi:MAG: hypothetical protein NVSMB65_11490 [Chloroflexota bacterium]
MLHGLLMFFFSFNPIICGLLLAAGFGITLRPASQQAPPLPVTTVSAPRRWRAAGPLRQAGRR